MKLFSILFLTYLFYINTTTTTCFIHNKRPNIKPLYMKKRLQERSTSPYYNPRTLNQKKYVESINNNQITIGIGPAGTGKTLFACAYAVNQLQQNKISKIILTRPIVTVEEDLGYLPGKLNSKMEPWTRPIFDIFLEYYDQRSLTSMLNNNVIEIAPLAYMRGRTFKNAIIIADEMQNSSPNQMMMVTTRIGENSKLLITGDLNQSDRYEDNGLKDLLGKLTRYKGNASDIGICHFTYEDVQRSKIVETLLQVYENTPERPRLPLPTMAEKRKHDDNIKEIEEKKSTSKRTQKQKNNDAALIPIEDVNRLSRNHYKNKR